MSLRVLDSAPRAPTRSAGAIIRRRWEEIFRVRGEEASAAGVSDPAGGAGAPVCVCLGGEVGREGWRGPQEVIGTARLIERWREGRKTWRRKWSKHG